MRLFTQAIDPVRMFELQNAQYREIIYMEDVVPAGSGGQETNLNISSIGHFYCLFLTGSFETIASPAAVIADTGVNYLFGQLRDGTRPLFNDRIPLNLFLSPGRRKSALSAGVLTDPVGNQLFTPIPFEYMFTVNSNITMNVANTSDEAVHFEIAFHGIRIVSNAAADNLRARAAIENRLVP